MVPAEAKCAVAPLGRRLTCGEGHATRPMNAESAAMTRRLAASVPTDSRNAFGSPKASSRRKIRPRAHKNVSASAAVRPGAIGKWTSTKLATLGVAVSPSLPISCASQGSHRALCLAAVSVCATSLICDPGRDRGLTNIEGAANTVEGIDYVGRPIEPAQPQCGQAVDLREGSARDDVVG